MFGIDGKLSIVKREREREKSGITNVIESTVVI